MEDGGVRTGPDDGAIAGSRSTGAKKFGFEFDLNRPFGDIGADHA